MVSIKVKFRPSLAIDKKGSIYYQLIHNRKVRQIHTGYQIFQSEWDCKQSSLTHEPETERIHTVAFYKEQIRCDIARLTRIIKHLDDKGLSYTADDIVAEFERYRKEYTLSAYMSGLISSLKEHRRTRTSETYQAALHSFRRFLNSSNEYPHTGGDSDIMLDAVTSEILEAYESHLRARGNSLNTISFYMRILRAVYNRAADNGIVEQHHPFRRVYTGIGKTIKRALPLKTIKVIKNLNLSAAPKLDYARDMFMLSFFLRGMSFVDMSFLKKNDLCHGYINYRRHKTGQTLRIEWTTEMQSILKKYPVNPTCYLLPILTKEGANERFCYRNAAARINMNLKQVAAKAGADIPLTLYCARHSWASAAKAKGIPVSIISEGMGHDSEMTTKIYLASIDTSAVDKANSLIIKSL